MVPYRKACNGMLDGVFENRFPITPFIFANIVSNAIFAIKLILQMLLISRMISEGASAATLESLYSLTAHAHSP